MKAQLATALEKVIAANPGPSAHPTSDKLISALELHYADADNSKAFKGSPAELVGTHWPDMTKPKTRTALLTNVEILSAAELEQVKKLHAEHKATLEDQGNFSPSAAHRDLIAQRVGFHASAKERGKDLKSADFKDLKSMQAEYLEKRQALDGRLELIVREAYPICKTAILNVEAALKSMIRENEAAEREIAQAFDLKWVPSQLWAAAAVNLMNARRSIRFYTGRADQGPSVLLDGFIKIN